VTIQVAIKACLAKRGHFGRPVAWKGTGLAIDLGRSLDTSKARQISPLGTSGGLVGSDWEVNPEDLLLDWEVVTNEDLAAEVCQKEDSDV